MSPHAPLTERRADRRRFACALALLVLALPSLEATRHPARAADSMAIVTPARIGGFQPASDVVQHSRISSDLCVIDSMLSAGSIDFAAVDRHYREGISSTEASGALRTLAKFARGGRASEALLSRYEKYYGAGWIDSFVRSALDGTGAFAGESDSVRSRALQSALRDQVVVGWAFHELDAAVAKAERGEFARATGAPHNWDEVWAYYHGAAPECAPYATAEARGREFGKGSSVNAAILAAMDRGLKDLLAGRTKGALKAREDVVRQMTITYVRSALKHSADMDAALTRGAITEARRHQADGLASFRVIEPLIAEADSTAALTVASVFDLGSAPSKGAGPKVAEALSRSYSALGIAPASIGRYRVR